MPLVEIVSDLEVRLPAPIRIAAAGARLPSGPLQLREEGGGAILPAQRDGDHVVAWIKAMPAGRKRRYHLEAGKAGPGVTVRDAGPNQVAIALPEGPFTTYNFDPAIPRPFFHPVA